MSRLMSRLISKNKINVYEIFRCATVSMVEHTAVNRGVVGSSPTRGA